MPRDNEGMSFENFIGLPGAEEFHLIQQTHNPPIPDDTAYIWILSSRHTILGECINCPKNPAMYIVNQSGPEAMECDTYDDFVRVEAALEIAQKLTVKRSQKKKSELTIADYKLHAPYIIYNGLDEQNVALVNLLNEPNGLSRISLPNLPASKFIIFGLPKELRHTGGQLHTLAALLKDEKTKKTADQDPRLFGLYKQNVSVIIDTAAYHLLRTRRYFNSGKFDNPLPHARITFITADRDFQRPCITRDCIDEMRKLEPYTQHGFIGDPIASSSWYDIASLSSWTPLRTHQYGQSTGSERIKALDLAELNPSLYKKLTTR